jgi:hypothetical protein
VGATAATTTTTIAATFAPIAFSDDTNEILSSVHFKSQYFP